MIHKYTISWVFVVIYCCFSSVCVIVCLSAWKIRVPPFWYTRVFGGVCVCTCVFVWAHTPGKRVMDASHFLSLCGCRSSRSVCAHTRDTITEHLLTRAPQGTAALFGVLSPLSSFLVSSPLRSRDATTGKQQAYIFNPKCYALPSELKLRRVNTCFQWEIFSTQWVSLITWGFVQRMLVQM